MAPDLSAIPAQTLFSENLLCVDLAVPLPVSNLFSYAVPESLIPKVQCGVRILAPFKNREIVGYAVNFSRRTLEHGQLKSIIGVLDDEPVLSAGMLELTRWISEYYGSSWGESIENALPKWVKYGKKAEKALQKPYSGEPFSDEQGIRHALSEEQAKAFEKIQSLLKEKKSKPVLLYGVTGSGKSEIYIHSIREVLKKNQSAICLVPEIALTEQLRRFFLNQFGNELEILHSKLTDMERFLAWKRIEQGTRRVILGPRSAVFAPVKNLGLIIMDEEHESSYKQETTPRYHAREVAEWRAAHENALFIMGTATPSLESMYRAIKGEILRLDLTKRIDDKAMPEVKIIDLKRNAGPKHSAILSIPLGLEIEANLKKKEGTILLLNRRGFSTHIHCQKCGHIESCNSCQVSLTFHQEDGILLCHYCNFQKPSPEACVQCGISLLRFGGFGTEKVESEIARRFPQARIARLDTDSVRKRGSHEVILKQFRERELDILIGTQMIAKGFDFPHVTLVGVILADVGLMLPDFRSAERTFQLLTQVAGRAGRGKIAGRVWIQTYSPDHPSIRFAKDHDFLQFYQCETAARLEHSYPPYCRLINIIIRGRDEKDTYVFARAVRELLDKTLNLDSEIASVASLPRNDVPKKGTAENAVIARRPKADEAISLEIIGPAPLPFYKLRGHFRWHVMIKSSRQLQLAKGIISILATLKRKAGVSMVIDVDPLNIL
ncbi:MAG: primosomal protein N' [Candidatus Omnitrophica bacterium]|nr:primosomal protein N' [Candidatus Omnitrophota bacterium]